MDVNNAFVDGRRAEGGDNGTDKKLKRLRGRYSRDCGTESV